MSHQKMSEDMFDNFRKGIRGEADTERYAHDTISTLLDEAERARRSEDEKDTTIATLADALRHIATTGYHGVDRSIAAKALMDAGLAP